MVPKMRAELLADDNDTAAAWEREDAKRMDRPAENFIVQVVVIIIVFLHFVCNATGEAIGAIIINN